MKKIIKNLFLLFFLLFAFSPTVFAKGNLGLNFNSIKRFDNSIICSGNFGGFIKEIFLIVKFAVPFLIIGLGIVDFIKAITAQSQEEVKKASTKLVKRLIIGICIFALPTIIDYLLKIAEVNSELCGW